MPRHNLYCVLCTVYCVLSANALVIGGYYNNLYTFVCTYFHLFAKEDTFFQDFQVLTLVNSEAYASELL